MPVEPNGGCGMTEELEYLLPFHANGTLEGEERALIEKALETDLELQKEAETLNLLRREIKGLRFDNSPGELGLNRLKQQIGPANGMSANDNGPAIEPMNRKPWIWRGVAAAACLALVLQAGYFLHEQKQESELDAAGGLTSTAPAAGAFLKVTFVPDAKEQNIRALLLSLDITIVGGPSSLGVYILATPRDVDTVMENLLRRTNLVESVQKDDRALSNP